MVAYMFDLYMCGWLFGFVVINDIGLSLLIWLYNKFVHKLPGSSRFHKILRAHQPALYLIHAIFRSLQFQQCFITTPT